MSVDINLLVCKCSGSELLKQKSENHLSQEHRGELVLKGASRGSSQEILIYYTQDRFQESAVLTSFPDDFHVYWIWEPLQEMNSEIPSDLAWEIHRVVKRTAVKTGSLQQKHLHLCLYLISREIEGKSPLLGGYYLHLLHIPSLRYAFEGPTGGVSVVHCSYTLFIKFVTFFL